MKKAGFQPILSGMLKVEASSACQLRCPSCPTTTGHTEAVVGKSYLRLADFVKLVDDNPWIGSVELSNYGEVFLNPDLLEIFRHAYRRAVTLEILNGANLNHVREEVLEGLVKYQVAGMMCSIDGASQETYKTYRVRGSFDRVIANIRRINEFKKAYGTSRPQLLWQFIAFGHNEHEIPAAKRLARELGMRFQVKLNWDESFSPVVNEGVVRDASGIGAATRKEFQKKYGEEYAQAICHDLWKNPQINWDGKVLGCCRNFWGDFGGNAFRDGLSESLAHEKLHYAREMLNGHAEPRADIPCTTCDIYVKRRAAKQWVGGPAPVAKRDAGVHATKLRNAALAWHSRGHLEEAAKSARILLQFRPDDKDALAVLADAAKRSGHAEAATYYADKAKKSSIGPKARSVR